MSIRQEDLKKLKYDILMNSSYLVNLEKEITRLKEEFTDIIRKEVISGYTQEELSVLEKLSTDFYDRVNFVPGYTFKRNYYDPKLPWIYKFDRSYQSPNYIEVPNSYPRDNRGSFYLAFPKDVLDKLIQINEEYISLCEKQIEIMDCFDRNVNKNTSLVWLKLNLPGVYKKLKSYGRNS